MSVSVSDIGLAMAFGLALMLLVDDEHAPTAAASTTASARPASHLMIPPHGSIRGTQHDRLVADAQTHDRPAEGVAGGGGSDGA